MKQEVTIKRRDITFIVSFGTGNEAFVLRPQDVDLFEEKGFGFKRVIIPLKSPTGIFLIIPLGEQKKVVPLSYKGIVSLRMASRLSTTRENVYTKIAMVSEFFRKSNRKLVVTVDNNEVENVKRM